MKRDEWGFNYKCSDVAEAAQKKAAHAEERLAWWKNKKQETFEKIKAEGLEIDESLAEQYGSFSNKGQFGPRIVVRTDLQRDLDECQTRINHWDKQFKEYTGWTKVLTAGAATTPILTLHHDDWLYFFGE